MRLDVRKLLLRHAGPASHMNYILNSLKGIYVGVYIGDYYREY